MSWNPFSALVVLAGLCVPAAAIADPAATTAMHGYPPPKTIPQLADPFAPKGPYFAGEAELVHIGPISLSETTIVCRVGPCYPIMTVLVDGRPIRFRDPEPEWKLLILDENGNRILSGGQIDFARLWRDNTTFLIQPVQAPTSIPRALEIRNRTGRLWRGVHVTPAATDHWGRDIASSTVKSGESFSAPLNGSGCLYDIRLKLDYPGEEQLLMGVDACASPTVTVTPGTGQSIERTE